MKINSFGRESFLGVIWGLIPLSYFATDSSTLALALFIPIYFVLFIFRGSSKAPREALEVLLFTGLLTLQSLAVEINSNIELFGYLRMAIFTINLCALLILIKRDNLGEFCTSFFVTTSLIAGFHIILILTGQSTENFGRYNFIGNSHPNLGGEIYAIAAFAGAMSLSKQYFAILVTTMLASSFLLQSRTGSAVMLMLLLLKLFCETPDRRLNTKSLVLGIGAMLVFTAAALIFESSRDFLINDVFRANDEYRGVSTGMITGRDQQWADALNIFYTNPLIGSGLNSFGEEDQRGAHSPILYALAMFGLSGILFWLYFGGKYWKILQIDRRSAIYLIPVTLMVVINDRFLNSNPFPLFFYLFLLMLARPVSKN